MNGILLVDKPSGWTSNDVVCKLKGVLHERRVGHSGTLDPMATGLLVIFAGRATRGVQFAENQRKSYSASVRLGVKTDTYDITGRVLSESGLIVSDNEFEKCTKAFIGQQDQMPPMYSAIKVNGKKLYELARKGIEAERKPRSVTIESISCKGKDSNGDFVIDVTCSKGTYIRSLIEDIGNKLGCGACMASLRRTDCGCFNISHAVKLENLVNLSPEEIENDYLIPVETLFNEYPEITVTLDDEKHIKCGNRVPIDNADGKYRVYSEKREFLMFGECIEKELVTIKSFFEV